MLLCRKAQMNYESHDDQIDGQSLVVSTQSRDLSTGFVIERTRKIYERNGNIQIGKTRDEG
jgi:hypothetical protein